MRPATPKTIRPGCRVELERRAGTVDAVDLEDGRALVVFDGMNPPARWVPVRRLLHRPDLFRCLDCGAVTDDPMVERDGDGDFEGYSCPEWSCKGLRLVRDNNARKETP